MQPPRRQYLQPEWPAPSLVRAYVTTRYGGVSGMPFDTFNLSQEVADEPTCVAANRATLMRDLDLPMPPIWLRQVHGVAVAIVGDKPAAGARPCADASISRWRHTVCAVLTADCLPILLCNRDGSEVGVIHAGWRGLLAGVIDATIQQLMSSPDDMLAWLGPALGTDHFALSEAIYADFINADPDYGSAWHCHQQRRYLDCYAMARLQLCRAGISAVYGGVFCTYDDQRFYSYRRDRGITGRMASLIFVD